MTPAALTLFQRQWFILPGESVWRLGAEGDCGQTGHSTLAPPLGGCRHQTEPFHIRGVCEHPARCGAGLQGLRRGGAPWGGVRHVQGTLQGKRSCNRTTN